MADQIVTWVEGLMSSPWVYVALFAIAAIDGFFPAVPSESLVITAGVFAASSGEPNLLLVILAAAVGAFVGDHISYTIGRMGGSRVRAKMPPGSKSGALFDWAERTLAQRGGLILVVARYIPGGRTAVTLTAGSVRFPLRKFSFYDGIAALSWGIYSAFIGYLGGHAFEDNPIMGLAVGLGIALAITGIVELVRHRLRKRSGAEAEFVGETNDGSAPENTPQETV